MADFNLADVLRETSAQDLGQAGREQIQYIDIDLIDPDPRNFYELSALDELAANIELVGLQQPLRVRKHPENPDRWMIVSGHRRRAAIRQLVDEGKDQLRAVACIVEQPAASDALQELRLIYANSGTRKLTPAEISKQAERVEMLLYELKEQGMEFPGRMRDHVAEACKVSKSKLSRLKVIREKLSHNSDIRRAFETNKLSEDAAYKLAQLPTDMQEIIFYSKYNDNGHLSAWGVEDGARRIEKINAIKCGEDKQCENRGNMYHRSLSHTCYSPCSQCCELCGSYLTCSKVCGILKANQKKRKADEKAREEKAKRDEEQRRQEAHASDWAAWEQLGDDAQACGVSADKVAEILSESRKWDYGNTVSALLGEEQGLKSMYHSPFDGYDGAKHLCAVADLLGVSTDYLLGRNWTPQPPRAAAESSPVWYDPAKGEHPVVGETVLALERFDKTGAWAPLFLKWTVDGWEMHGFMAVPGEAEIRWQHYHDPELDVPDSGTDEESEEIND